MYELQLRIAAVKILRILGNQRQPYDVVTVVIIALFDDVELLCCSVSFLLFPSFVPRLRNHGFYGIYKDVSMIGVILTR